MAPSIDIDHIVIGVKNLAAGAETYRRLGFTLSPRGVHSASMGTANHTIMLQHDYFELLTILQPTERNTAWRTVLEAMGDGIIGMAVSTDDAAGTQAAWTAAGLSPGQVTPFARAVEREGHPPTEARFETVQLPTGTLEGVGVFACRHFTRDAVWLPELMQHANTAVGIERLVVSVPDPAATAARWNTVFGAGISEVGGLFRLTLPTHAVDFVRGQVGAPVRASELVFKVAALQACATALAAGGVPHNSFAGQIAVASADAGGVALSFVPA